MLKFYFYQANVLGLNILTGFLGHLTGQRMAILKYFMVNGDNPTRVFHVNISGGGVSSGPGRGYRRLVPDQFISNSTTFG